jgi:hypothetical protein
MPAVYFEGGRNTQRSGRENPSSQPAYAEVLHALGKDGNLGALLSGASLATQQSSCTGFPRSSNLQLLSSTGLPQIQQLGVALSRGAKGVSSASLSVAQETLIRRSTAGDLYFDQPRLGSCGQLCKRFLGSRLRVRPEDERN